MNLGNTTTCTTAGSSLQGERLLSGGNTIITEGCSNLAGERLVSGG
jgi:hypothetical protein